MAPDGGSARSSNLYSISSAADDAPQGGQLRQWLSHFVARTSSKAVSHHSFSRMTDTSRVVPTADAASQRASSSASTVALLPLPHSPSGRKGLSGVGGGSMRHRGGSRPTLRVNPVAEERDANDMGGKLAQNNALKRDLDLWNQIGVCNGVCTYMYLFTGVNSIGALMNGGSGSLLYGFIFAALGYLISAASLAELTSACPTSSGLYFFTARLAPRKLMPYLSFMTGWINIIGAITGLGLVAQQIAQFALAVWYMTTVQPVLQLVEHEAPVYVWTGGYVPTSQHVSLGIYSLVIVLCGTINMVPIQVSAWFTTCAAFSALFFGPAMAITMLVVAPVHQPASFVFATLTLHPEVTGVTNPIAAWLLGTSTSIGLMFGYDTCMYLVEECENPTINTPRGMVLGIAMTGTMGLLTFIGVLFSIQDPEALFDPSTVTSGAQAGAQALWDVFAARYSGDGRGSLGVVAIIGIVQVLLFIIWIMGTSRKVYAMARDELLPCSSIFSKVTRRGVPLNALLLIMGLLLSAGPLMLLYEYQLVYLALTSCTATATFLSYLIPVVTSLVSGVKIRPGPFDLGRWSKPVNWFTACFLTFCLIISAIPQFYPVTPLNMNYAGPCLLAMLLLLHVCWFLPKPFGARHWARGPVSGVVAGVQYRL